MYANRYAPSGFSTGGLIAAVAVNAGLAAVLLTLSPGIRETLTPRILTTTNIPIEVPPPPEPVPPPPEAKPMQVRTSVPTRVDVTTARVPTTPTAPYQPPIPAPPFTGPVTGFPAGTGTGVVPAIDPVVVLPRLVGSAVDPRYARDFQPDYPPSERRAESEGVVVIRVLIGIDGRVKATERVSAASDAFWRVTEAQAMRRWRFRPATRDGIPEESWRQFTVRFEMDR